MVLSPDYYSNGVPRGVINHLLVRYSVNGDVQEQFGLPAWGCSATRFSENVRFVNDPRPMVKFVNHRLVWKPGPLL